ncbi:MAG: ComF family protein [Clostridiales bacterium]|nr:ComF family protein [Clostridiales bacterium]
MKKNRNKSIFSPIIENLLYTIFPKRCFFCGKVISPRENTCEECGDRVERVERPSCIYCGCGKDRCSCGKKRGYYEALAAVYYYNGPARECIHRFKFSGQSEIGKSIAREMAETARTVFDGVKFDLVTSVPMRKKNIRARGFNQSELLAIETGRLLDIPVNNSLLVKLYDTESQHDLPELFRSGNIFGVFDVTDRDMINGKTVLLCDDVTTSGATLNECAKMLVINGAEKVYCLTAATTFTEKKKGSGFLADGD